MTTASSTSTQLLHLYRKLLRACQTFPSRKRNAIHQAIREDFRANQTENNLHKIEQQISVAIKGLDQLQQFHVNRMTSSGKHAATWNVHLEPNPMPKPDDYEERTKQARSQTKK